MSVFFIWMFIIVALCCLPHLITKIAVDMIAGIKLFFRGCAKVIVGIFKLFGYFLMGPVRIYKEIIQASRLLGRQYRSCYSKYSSERKRKERHTKAMNAKKQNNYRRKLTADEFDGQFFKFNAQLKALNEQQSSTTMIAKITEDDHLSIPTFFRQGHFRTINGRLWRDDFGNPVKISVADMFTEPAVQIQVPNESAIASTQEQPQTDIPDNVIEFNHELASTELDEEGFDIEYDPYVGIA